MRQVRRGRATAAVLSAVVASTGLMVATAPAAHADYFSGGMPTTNFTVTYSDTLNPTYRGHFNQARLNWNERDNAFNIRLAQGTSSNRMLAGRYDATWYGLYRGFGNRQLNRTFEISVNARTLVRDAPSSQTSQWIRSTSTHELGHALSLADNPNTSEASLMKHSRNRGTIVKPQSYDVREVRRIY